MLYVKRHPPASQFPLHCIPDPMTFHPCRSLRRRSVIASRYSNMRHISTKATIGSPTQFRTTAQIKSRSSHIRQWCCRSLPASFISNLFYALKPGKSRKRIILGRFLTVFCRQHVHAWRNFGTRKFKSHADNRPSDSSVLCQMLKSCALTYRER